MWEYVWYMSHLYLCKKMKLENYWLTKQMKFRKKKNKRNVKNPLFLNLLGGQNLHRAQEHIRGAETNRLPAPPAPAPLLQRHLTGALFTTPSREMIINFFTEWSEFLGCFNIN